MSVNGKNAKIILPSNTVPKVETFEVHIPIIIDETMCAPRSLESILLIIDGFCSTILICLQTLAVILIFKFVLILSWSNTYISIYKGHDKVAYSVGVDPSPNVVDKINSFQAC